MDIIKFVFYIIFIPCFFLGCYYAFLSIIGLFFHKQKYDMTDDKERFCIFVPCHNEEPVISATVKNLLNIQYNKELFDVYFIADNCTDKTAEKIRQTIDSVGAKNFFCLERNVTDKSKRGKPHAMRWGMDLLNEKGHFYGYYDMFITLDADNFVDSDILKHINSQYQSYSKDNRPVMIQVYLDSKNKENLVSRGYYVAYRFTNGFFQLPRHKMGLVPGIGGTGFAITTDFLKEIGGYNCSSLTEDLEIETLATLKCKRIAYNHNVRIYDEKPTGIRASAIQKTRWAQGHWYIFFKYGYKMFFRMFHPKELKFFFKRLDNFIYLCSMLFMTLSMGMILLSLLATFSGKILPYYTVNTIIGIFMILMFPISSLYDGSPKEKRRVIIDFIPNILATVLFSIIYFYANIAGLVKCHNQKVWKKTAHKVTVLSYETDKKGLKERV